MKNIRKIFVFLCVAITTLSFGLMKAPQFEIDEAVSYEKVAKLSSNAVTMQSSELPFEDAFDYDVFAGESLFDSEVWKAEEEGGGGSYNAELPIVENGVMMLSKGMSAQFVWQKLGGFTFSSSKTYTLKFDVKVTSFGDNSGLSNAWKRELYFAPGGYYNQVELRSDNSNKCIRTGDTWGGSNGNEYKLNTVYTVEAVWSPSDKKITTTLKNGTTVVSTGYRTNDAFADASSHCGNWVMRCEDGSIEIDNFSFSDGTNTYTQGFEFATNDSSMIGAGYWSYEGTNTAPDIDNGVVKMDSGDSIRFNWIKLASYDINNTYNFEFDFKVTNLGNGSTLGSENMTRALYVAFGGWWNQVEVNNVDGKVRAGNTYVDNVENYYNKPLRAKVQLQGTNVYSAIYTFDGTCLVAGVRTDAGFTNMSDGKMTNLVIRCEDGAVEIDNFKLSVGRVEVASSTDITIEKGKRAKYSIGFEWAVGNCISIDVNNVGVFSISEFGISIGGASTKGEYGAGAYNIDVIIDPTHGMLAVEVVIPSGRVIRRGTYSLVTPDVTNYTVSVKTMDKSKIGTASVTYGDVTVTDYEIITQEPVNTGYNVNVYNIITSFSDASTTRSFAFTALASYVNGEDMLVAYKAKGDDLWSYVVAINENDTANVTEDYYKADIFGLTPNTEYEYKIGKENGDVGDWSNIYSFKTASEQIDQFTFVAVGDTQGVTWNGTTSATKGFMFAQAAYVQAMKDVSDPAFIMHAGDVVENAHTEEQWNLFFKALGDIGTRVPHFATIGNHDVHNLNSNGAEFYYDFHFNHPNNGGVEALDPDWVNQITNNHLQALVKAIDETIYSFDYGNAHFTVIASGNYTASDRYLLEAQRAWLDADLKANADAKWKIVMFHEPVYHRVGGNESRPWLYDVIENNNVDLVLQGHSHLVTRTYPMKNGKIATFNTTDTILKGDGTVYTTLGATAYNHDSLGNPNMEEMFLIKTPAPEMAAYTTVSIDDDKIVMTIKQIDGLVLDQFEICDEDYFPGHDGKIVTVGKEKETCIKDGYTGDKVCSKCNEVVRKGIVLPATGTHEFAEVVDGKFLESEATCTEYAVYKKSCKMCGLPHESETFSDIETGLGHDIVQNIDDKYLISSATCTKPAKYYKSCFKCGAKIKETFENGKPLEHNYQEIVKSEYRVSVADCNSPAVYKKSCVDCGEAHATETFEGGVVLGHKYEEVVEDKYLVTGATCSSPAVYKLSCSRCGEAHESEIFQNGASLVHNYVFKQTVAPVWSTKTDGYDLYECEHDSTHTTKKNVVSWSTLSAHVQVENGKINGANNAIVEKGTSVTVIADTLAGKTFKHWEIGGTVVSENSEYTFVVNDTSVSVKAVYEIKETKPASTGCGQNAMEIFGLIAGMCLLAFMFKKH